MSLTKATLACNIAVRCINLNRPRLSDIAKEAGVSTATMSNALNYKSGVARAKAEELRRLAAQMGYVNENNSDSGSVRLVIYKKYGKVVQDTPFFAQLIEGIQSECQKLSSDLLINHVSRGEDLVSLLDRPVLLLATEMDSSDLVPFRKLSYPLLLLDSDFRFEPYSSVTIDNFEAGYLAGRALIDSGHSRIGFLDSSLPFNNMRDRYAGFCEALRESKLEPFSRVPLEPTMEGSYHDMAEYLLSHSELPTAFFAGNDIIAIGASRALKQAGLRLPEELSMIGMDDMPMCQVVEPTLSTIRVDKHTFGVIAVDRLHDMLENRQNICQRIRMSVTFIQRNSVTIPRS